MASTHYCARCLTTFVDDPERCPNMACGGNRPKKGWGDLLQQGDLLDRHYQIVKPLAVGGAGLTYLAREVDGDGQPVPPDLAIKVLYTQRDGGPFLQRLANEAQILQNLAHENIVQCMGFVHRAGHAPYLVTLFEHGGSLSGHIERVGAVAPTVAAGILRQVMLALDVAHQRGVVHRDLKPDNVLLREPVERDTIPHCRVADFGIAKIEGGVGQRLTRFGAFVGTPEYAAPEQFEGMAPTPATDVFAAGGLLFYLLTTRPPVNFEHRADIEHSYHELLKQIPPLLPPIEGADPREQAALQEVLDNMMRPQPGDRWTIHQVLARLAAMAQDVPHEHRYRTTVGLEPGAPPAFVRPDGTLDTRSQETFASWQDDARREPQRVVERRRQGTIDSVPTGVNLDGPPPPPNGPRRPAAAPSPASAASPAAAAPAPAPAPAMPASASAGMVQAPANPYGAPPQTSPRTAPVPAPRRGGAAALGVATMLLLVGGASVVAVIAVVAAAFAFGWFGPPPAVASTVDVPPVVVASGASPSTPTTPTTPSTTTPTTPTAPTTPATPTVATLSQGEHDVILKALKDKGVPMVVKACRPGTVVGVRFTIGPQGRVSAVEVDGDVVPHKTEKCIEDTLLGLKVPRETETTVELRESLAFL